MPKGPADPPPPGTAHQSLDSGRKKSCSETRIGASWGWLSRPPKKQILISYPKLVRSLERDLLELLAFFSCPRHQWKRLRTTHVIERCFVEVRRRTRPMVCFMNVKSVDRIVFSIFHRFNLDGSSTSSQLLHKQLDITPPSASLTLHGPRVRLYKGTSHGNFPTSRASRRSAHLARDRFSSTRCSYGLSFPRTECRTGRWANLALTFVLAIP